LPAVPKSPPSAEEATRTQLAHVARPSAIANPRLQLPAVFFAALAIRLGAVIVLQPRLAVDGAGYLAWAQAVVRGDPSALAELRVEHAPLYGLFLAVGLLIPAVQITWFVVLSQAVAGAATAVVLARLTARETGSRIAGLCAGAIAAVQISFVFWTAYVVSETLFLLIVAVAADRVLLLRCARHPARDALALGILALLSLAARPTGAAFVLAMLVLMVIAAWRHLRRLAVLLGGFSAPFLLVLVLTAAAAQVSGSSVLASIPTRITDWTRSAVENGLLWTETGRATVGIDLGVNPPPVVQTLPPEQRDEFLREGPLTFAARHPVFFLQQTLRKLRMFWAPALLEYTPIHTVAASLFFVPFYALALAGFVLARRAIFLITLCGLSVVLFTLTSVLTIVDYDQRYRLPAELFLIPLAGCGLAWLIGRRWSARETATYHAGPPPAWP
jgi:hypothetical protein